MRLERSTGSSSDLSAPRVPARGARYPGRSGLPDLSTTEDWRLTYRRAAHRADLATVVTAVAASHAATGPALEPTRLAMDLLVALAWFVSLRLHRSAGLGVVGHGPAEYVRLTRATLTTFGVFAVIAGLARSSVAWPYLAVSLPVGFLGLLTARKLLRMWLVSRRRRGSLRSNVLVLGSVRSAALLDRHLSVNRAAGLRVCGVWVADAETPGQAILETERGTEAPVLGGSADLAEALRRCGADTVVITNSEHLGSHGVRELAWELHAAGGTLLVSPNVADVAAPRLELQLIGGMPLLHVEKPSFEGATRVNKRVFDLALASAATIALTPVMLLVALAVRCTSRGPVLYRSERIGTGGVPFTMLKFRTMVATADQARDELLSEVGGPLFKIRDDPRVTGLGRFLRRYSLDELPQLLNVVRGEMSIVGPRPPLRSEVEQYDENVGRRLLVKQGLTGLWQVSGRSNLSWDDAVRLDLDYVENWSMRRDLRIIWQTFRAVLSRDGAY